MSKRIQCGWTGKDVYFTQGTADKARNKYNKHRHTSLAYYRCKKCSYWHLYNKKKREKPDESVPDRA